jgi:hypothetical protein
MKRRNGKWENGSDTFNSNRLWRSDFHIIPYLKASGKRNSMILTVRKS